MDRNTVLRWFIIGGLLLAFWKWGMPAISGKSSVPQAAKLPAETYVNAPNFAPDPIDPPASVDTGAAAPAPSETCKIRGNRFDAELTTRGAGLTHFYLRDSQYAGTNNFDMSTTPDIERWHSLRTLFRGETDADEKANDQVDYDRLVWNLERQGDTGCIFTYEDGKVRLVKKVTAGERPFELNVETQVTNLASTAKKHRFSIGAFAFHENHEMKGSFGRISPFQTELVCARDKDVTRKSRDSFKEGWYEEPLVDRFTAISSTYFAQALVPTGPAPASEKAECRVLAEDWYSEGQSKDDDKAGAVFHAELTYPSRELAPQASATYSQIAFLGPKERNVLGKAAGGEPKLGDLIDLGMFSPVAKVLVSVLLFFRNKVTLGNWGLAIVLMTVALRMGLFPLTWKSIKTTVAMRRFKPELDAINKKFEGDAQAKQMATMELYRKHGVNPLGGCLPQLVQMPVWFAMYRTLQTAVELYHEKFLWFHDLSAPDPYYILPLTLGAFMIVQQRIVPQQGMDPMQQKMMMYLLPIMFTGFMLFLPAALCIYSLTNSVLAIVQQLAVEKLAPRNALVAAGGGKGDIVVSQVGGPGDGETGAKAPAFGKGKARV